MSGSRGVCAAHGARAVCVSARGCRRTKDFYREVSLYESAAVTLGVPGTTPTRLGPPKGIARGHERCHTHAFTHVRQLNLLHGLYQEGAPVPAVQHRFIHAYGTPAAQVLSVHAQVARTRPVKVVERAPCVRKNCCREAFRRSSMSMWIYQGASTTY